MAHGSKKVIVVALLANLGIAAAKFAAAIITQSAAMMAEAVHSCADSGNQILLLVGISRAQKPPTEDHPFGFAMESYFWSFIVAIMLFSLGGLFSIYHALHKWHEIHQPEYRHEGGYSVAVFVVLLAIALETYSWWVATREANSRRGDQSMWQFIQSSKSPEIIVIWLEDTAALVGLLFALVGLVLMILTGDQRWDVYASCSIGVLLIGIAAIVGAEIKSLLIGEAALPETRARIRAIVENAPQVVALHELLSMQLGEDDVMVAMKIEWDPAIPTGELFGRIDAIEASIRAEYPRVRWLFIEPGVSAETLTDEPEHPQG